MQIWPIFLKDLLAAPFTASFKLHFLLMIRANVKIKYHLLE